MNMKRVTIMLRQTRPPTQALREVLMEDPRTPTNGWELVKNPYSLADKKGVFSLSPESQAPITNDLLVLY